MSRAGYLDTILNINLAFNTQDFFGFNLNPLEVRLMGSRGLKRSSEVF